MNIVLIGYRCTGKTSVGRRLAALMNTPFYDTDELIQEEMGTTIRSIVESDGWPAFRAAEKRMIAALAVRDGCVIALGGGAVLDPDNIHALKKTGRLIWLTADEETILKRLALDAVRTTQRPPLRAGDGAAEVSHVLRERTPIYAAAADLTIDTTGGSPDGIVNSIHRCLGEMTVI
jgi:shikimate kinase